MRKRGVAAGIALLIVAATCGLFYLYLTATAKETPQAQDGWLDLTGWRFDRDGAIPLNGDWSFYPGKLIFPEAGSDAAGASELSAPATVRVPGDWRSEFPALGVATYRLQIKVGDGDRVYGLKMSKVQVASRVIVNGETVGESGNPAPDGDYVAMNKPYAAYFALRPGWNDIVIQIANYDLPGGGGIVNSIYFGYAAQISALSNQGIAHDWILITAFLIMGLYFIGMFSQRRDDVFLITFGSVCIFMALYISTNGERVLWNVIDSCPFWLYYRIQILSAIGVGSSFLLYLYTAFRPFCSRWLVRSGLILAAALTVLATGWIQRLNIDYFLPMVSLVATAPLLYAVYIFVLAALNRVEGSLYLVVAAVSLIAFALIHSGNIYVKVPYSKIAPFEPFLFLLMLSLLISHRFANAYRKIEELSVQLIAANNLKDEFLVRTSHEFKTPLHGVMNITQSMLEDAEHPLTEEQQERLRLITNIAGRLSRLVYDILDFSRLRQGELAVHPLPVDVRTAVDVQLRIHSFLSEDRQIRLVNRVPERLPFALADEIRLNQIVGNLLDNAIKHTRNGVVEVTAKHRNGRIEISVRDTGDGIDESKLSLLFEPFKTAGSKAEPEGFGLGLAIVKQLVELHGGEVSVSSVLGEGTTVTFTLPAAERERALRAAPRPVPPLEPEFALRTPYRLDQNGEHTVLVVDDNHSNLKVLIDALRPLGYNVVAVQNGEEALVQLARPGVIDLAVLDLMMPGMSGFELCQVIREKYTVLELPVLMVTAAIQPRDKLAAFAAGANDFLPKPFDVAELKARVGNLLLMKKSLGKAVDLEVAFLQSQIKPHFLYNALNSIAASSYTDIERARSLTTDLADYLRGSFRFSNLQKRVSFREELSLIRSYVKIEQARFKERIRVEFDIAENLHDVRIPPLLIQPLVENAIRHGIGNRLEGGTVNISAYGTDDGEHYVFVVADDGVGMERERLKRPLSRPGDDGPGGVGLLNINKRLKYEYGTELQIDSEPGRGTTVTVRIPAETGHGR